MKKKILGVLLMPLLLLILLVGCSDGIGLKGFKIEGVLNQEEALIDDNERRISFSVDDKTEIFDIADIIVNSGIMVDAFMDKELTKGLDDVLKLNEGSNIFYIRFLFKERKAVWTLEIVREPDSMSIDRIEIIELKKEYRIDEKLGSGRLRVHNIDGTSYDISITPAMVLGFDTSRSGSHTIAISYKGNEVDYSIIVLPSDDMGKMISCKVIDYKKEYYQNEKFDYATLKVTYEHGEMIIPVDTTMLEGFSTEETGYFSYYISFKDQRILVDYTVDYKYVDASVYSFKDKYYVGEEYYPGKLLVTTNGKREIVEITRDMVSNFSTEAPGSFYASFSYEGYSFSRYYSVVERDYNKYPSGDYLDIDHVKRLIADLMVFDKDLRRIDSFINERNKYQNQISLEEAKAYTNVLEKAKITNSDLTNLNSYFEDYFIYSYNTLAEKYENNNKDIKKALLALQEYELNDIIRNLNLFTELFSFDRATLILIALESMDGPSLINVLNLNSREIVEIAKENLNVSNPDILASLNKEEPINLDLESNVDRLYCYYRLINSLSDKSYQLKCLIRVLFDEGFDFSSDIYSVNSIGEALVNIATNNSGFNELNAALLKAFNANMKDLISYDELVFKINRRVALFKYLEDFGKLLATASKDDGWNLNIVRDYINDPELIDINSELPAALVWVSKLLAPIVEKIDKENNRNLIISLFEGQTNNGIVDSALDLIKELKRYNVRILGDIEINEIKKMAREVVKEYTIKEIEYNGFISVPLGLGMNTFISYVNNSGISFIIDGMKYSLIDEYILNRDALANDLATPGIHKLEIKINGLSRAIHYYVYDTIKGELFYRSKSPLIVYYDSNLGNRITAGANGDLVKDDINTILSGYQFSYYDMNNNINALMRLKDFKYTLELILDDNNYKLGILRVHLPFGDLDLYAQMIDSAKLELTGIITEYGRNVFEVGPKSEPFVAEFNYGAVLVELNDLDYSLDTFAEAENAYMEFTYNNQSYSTFIEICSRGKSFIPTEIALDRGFTLNNSYYELRDAEIKYKSYGGKSYTSDIITILELYSNYYKGSYQEYTYTTRLDESNGILNIYIYGDGSNIDSFSVNVEVLEESEYSYISGLEDFYIEVSNIDYNSYYNYPYSAEALFYDALRNSNQIAYHGSIEIPSSGLIRYLNNKGYSYYTSATIIDEKVSIELFVMDHLACRLYIVSEDINRANSRLINISTMDKELLYDDDHTIANKLLNNLVLVFNGKYVDYELEEYMAYSYLEKHKAEIKINSTIDNIASFTITIDGISYSLEKKVVPANNIYYTGIALDGFGFDTDKLATMLARANGIEEGFDDKITNIIVSYPTDLGNQIKCTISFNFKDEYYNKEYMFDKYYINDFRLNEHKLELKNGYIIDRNIDGVDLYDVVYSLVIDDDKLILSANGLLNILKYSISYNEALLTDDYGNSITLAYQTRDSKNSFIKGYIDMPNAYYNEKDGLYDIYLRRYYENEYINKNLKSITLVDFDGFSKTIMMDNYDERLAYSISTYYDDVSIMISYDNRSTTIHMRNHYADSSILILDNIKLIKKTNYINSNAAINDILNRIYIVGSDKDKFISIRDKYNLEMICEDIKLNDTGSILYVSMKIQGIEFSTDFIIKDREIEELSLVFNRSISDVNNIDDLKMAIKDVKISHDGIKEEISIDRLFNMIRVEISENKIVITDLNNIHLLDIFK